MANILNIISNPSQLKQLPLSQLPVLATEIRNRIIEVVSKSGGHLAPSLGVVELAIALHYVFDAPSDKIIWDVGHQSYPHKLLTGRQQQFETLRKYRGLSGFTRISESPYDAFSSGHASTSISAGLGMTCGKHLKGEDSKVIAVIGDGALTGGIAFEGLNQTGDLKKNLIIIVNDNNMSIAPNVGALSSILSRAFSKKRMQAYVREVGKLIKSLPGIGDDAYHFAKRSKASFKTFITPGMLFEAFGIEYFGPIDGNNLNQLINILDNLKKIDGPVLLHVKTKKGRDYEPAEKNPVYFHGCSCFDIETGRCLDQKSSIPSYTEVFGDTMVKLAAYDSGIVAITAAMPEGTGLKKFAKAFPERFFDVGIAEQHAVTFAAGLAAEGLKPVVAIYSTFLQRAYDQLVHDVCLDRLPVVFAIDRAGIVGEDGPTHQGLFDLSYLRSLPNMVVMAPKDENELQQMLKTAIDHDGPTAIRYPRGTAIGVPLETSIDPLPLGKAEIVETGCDALLLAIGRGVSEALAACSTLKKEGIETTVVNCRFVKPLDANMLAMLARDIPRIVTVEENVRQGGFGSAVWECLNDQGLNGFRIERVGVGDTFVEHGSPRILRTKYGVDAAAIVKAVKKLYGSACNKMEQESDRHFGRDGARFARI
jgi:1-deoxy-D-xylulose-5-phosphate synthase